MSSSELEKGHGNGFPKPLVGHQGRQSNPLNFKAEKGP